MNARQGALTNQARSVRDCKDLPTVVQSCLQLKTGSVWDECQAGSLRDRSKICAQL